MDERGYLLQALLERLRDEGIETTGLGEGAIAVSRRDFAAIPRRVARFCQEVDLQLVQLYAPQRRTWRFVLAWHDDVGHPRFLRLAVTGDDELLGARPDLLFRHGLREILAGGGFDDEQAAWLSALWHADPRGAIEQIRRTWRRPRDFRLFAQAAKHGDWRAVRSQLARLLRSARPASAWLLRMESFFRRQFLGPVARVAFSGAPTGELAGALARDLAPAFPAGMRAVQSDARDAVGLDAASLADLERSVLRWLECRVERRYPEALVGNNGVFAKSLQRPWTRRLVQPLLNCAIDCPLPSPVLMPYPFGIVIDRGSRLGSRVTVMHQVTIFEAVIEDNVTIGPGAKIIGPLRIGRGARIGANAVVTGDVFSHENYVAPRRQRKSDAVVNT
jgi:hypothetical protein